MFDNQCHFGKMKMMRIVYIFIMIMLSGIVTSELSTANGEQKNNNYNVPQWAKKVVWYQIFPERFRNGDPANDPEVQDIKGSWPHDWTSPWEVHPWTSDWYKLQPYEKKNGKNIWFNIQRRRYGGDLQGVIDKLDYLQELGIGAIYFNPVFESPSSHKYDGATYHHIDPNFGPDLEGDRELINQEIPHDPSTWVWTEADKLMLKLIGLLHDRGIKVIFDGVFNHMGLNSWAFKDVKEKQQHSIYKDWFSIKSWENSDKKTKFDYQGWFGFRELPELREDKNGIVEGPKKYIFDITKRWMDPNGDGKTNDGIDGWRLDVAFCVSHKFWKDWRKHVKSINADAYLTAEVIDHISVLKPYLQGDEFDAVMNYNFAFTCAEYFFNEKDKINTSQFDKKLRRLREAFPDEVTYTMQNLFGSHDANRIGSHIVNRDLANYRNWGRYHGISKGDNPKCKTRKPTTNELQLQKLFAIFQMTYVGAPMIYYGDEVGMWGANDPCCRKPMIWSDLKYEDEVYFPDQSEKEKSDRVEVNQDLFAHFQKLIRIRNQYQALQLGDFKPLLVDDQNGIYSFSRCYEGQYIIVILNNGDIVQTVQLEETDGRFYDLLNEDVFLVDENNLTVNVKAKWGRILLREEKLE